MVNSNEQEGRFEGQEQHGWAPDVGTGGSDRATEANKKAFGEPPAGGGPGKEESEAERTGVPPTDTDARTPLGTGTSTRKGGEEHGEEGDEERRTLGTKGESGRPYGDTNPEKDAGVNPQAPVDPDSPYLPPA
jgi:hypothetical protein